MYRMLGLLIALALTGCSPGPAAKTKVVLEFRPAETKAVEGFMPMTVAGAGQTVYVSREIALSNADVASARVTRGREGSRVQIVFTEAGARKFADATERSFMRPLAILVDGQLVCAPIVREKIVGGEAEIAGRFTEEEAGRIANGIAPR